MTKKLLLLFIVFIAYISHAQYIPISKDAEVSILTIGPGAELYDSFGHSAFRVKDPTNKFDIVYNYGVFDFNTPNFYTKFAQGKLLYELGVSYYEPFFERYKNQDRWVKEQVLNLTYEEKEAVFNFLQNNAKPENKKYKYDFFYDNCATKMRDVLTEVLGDKLEYREDHITDQYTFRELIQQNLHWNTWGSLGIDFGLGALIDRVATPNEFQFLPDYIFKGAENAFIKKNSGEEPLVSETSTLYSATNKKIESNFLTSPLVIFGLLGLIIVFITFKDRKNHTRTRTLDSILFFTTGLVGVVFFLLWFATDHTATVNNYNLLWAFPFNILFFIAIARRSPKSWLRKYIIFLILLLILLTIHWITGVQIFAYALIPLLLAIAVRFVFLAGYLKKS